MSEKQPKFHEWFHKFLVYFALWAYALFAIVYGVRAIWETLENEPGCMPLFIFLGALMIALGLYIVKVRFDLVKRRRVVVKELPAICFIAAAIMAMKMIGNEMIAEDTSKGTIFALIIFACWGIALYRYYKERAYLFQN